MAFEGHSLGIKTILVGASAAGKTALVIRLMHNTFDATTSTTMGAAFSTLSLKSKEELYKLLLWDTAGQERFASLLSMYTRNSSIVLFVLNQSSSEALEQSRIYIQSLEKIKGSATIFIVPTHNDKTDCSSGAAEALQKELVALGHTVNGVFSVSSKTGGGIPALKEALGKCAAPYWAEMKKETEEQQLAVAVAFGKDRHRGGGGSTPCCR